MPRIYIPAKRRARFDAAHPELAEKARRKKRRVYRLKKTYGLSRSDYERLYAIQGGRCAICRDTQEKPLSIDHCHETERVRGLLCHACNSALGFMREDPLIAIEMRRYIEERCIPARRAGPIG